MSYYIAPNATVVGDVSLGENISVWYGAVLRGDSGAICLADGVNVQDNAVLHECISVGKNTSVGHGVILHGCTVGENCVIGMGAIVLNGAVIGNDCIVGAGALVTGKMNAPDGSLILGSPAKVVRPLTPEEIADNAHNAAHYIELAKAQL